MPLSLLRKDKRALEGKLAALSAKPFAHRGLHGPGKAVENSLAAFDAAIASGFGIELDVQLTAENGAVVFHDSTLERLSEGEGPVNGFSMRALTATKLRDSNETISSLQDVLHHIGGRTPLLIEAKAGDRNPEAVGMAIRRALEGYVGPVGIMSFHPAVSRWYHDHFPSILNGLVMSEERDTVGAPWRGSGPARLLAVRQARPKFIAYDIRSLPSGIAKAFRKPGHRAFTWTVRTEDDINRGLENADQLIVEGAAAAKIMNRSASA